MRRFLKSSDNYKLLRVNGLDLLYRVEQRNVRYPRLEFRTSELLVILPIGWNDERPLLMKKIGWISKKYVDIKRVIEKFRASDKSPGILIRGEFFKFQPSDSLKIIFDEKSIECDLNNRNHLKQLVSLLKKELLEELKSAAIEYSDKFGVRFNRIFIRRQRTKWGSCSSRGNLSFNLLLICLPRELMRYVACHEVFHLREKRHGKAFWRAMENEFENYEQLEKSLSEYWFLVQEQLRSNPVANLLGSPEFTK